MASAYYARWQGLPARDRLALVGLTAFLFVVVLFLQIGLPAKHYADQARDDWQTQRELLAYLQHYAPLLQGKTSEKPVQPLDPSRLQGVVTATAQQFGLRLHSLDSASEGQLQLTLGKASFAPFISWIIHLQAQGVQVHEVSIDRVGESQVDVNLTLKVG